MKTSARDAEESSTTTAMRGKKIGWVVNTAGDGITTIVLGFQSFQMKRTLGHVPNAAKHIM